MNEIVTPSEVLDPFLAKMKAIEDSMTPEQRAAREARYEESKRRDYEMKVNQFRYDWGAPKRHVETATVKEGPWGEKYRSIAAMLGSGFMIALIGGRGSGKTQMAVQLMKHATAKLTSAKFITAVQFFMEIKETYKRDCDSAENDILEKFSRPSLLVIDEIGKRGGSDWENNLLFELLNRRYNDMKDTIMIDNRSKADFIETIGPSIASRMSENGGIIECNWQSFRNPEESKKTPQIHS
jgi:DNA replication protein DnaC